MPTVTAIKPQKSKRSLASSAGKKRVNVFLDNKFGFGLDLETFVKLGLKVGKELSERDVEKIVKEGEFQNTYDKILRFATLRPRSEREFKTWLFKYKVHESLNEELFNRLKRLELLDDKKFATWWVEQRVQFKSLSKKELYQELRTKGVSSEIITDVLGCVRIDEKAAIKKLLSRKERLWEGLSGFERRKKIYSYLAGKGFSYDTIRDIVGNDGD